MAWTKMKTAVVVGVAAILATCATTIVVKEMFFPLIKDDYFQPNYQHFQNLPRGLFTLRTTHFTSPTNGFDYSAETSSPSGEHVTLFIGRNRSFEQLIAKAYGGSPPTSCFRPICRMAILIIYAPSSTAGRGNICKRRSNESWVTLRIGNKRTPACSCSKSRRQSRPG